MRKARKTIAVEDVGRIFNDERIDELTNVARLPASAERRRFTEGIREAVRIFARDVREPSVNEIHAEIAELVRAADGRRYGRLVILIERLSPQARNLLNGRGEQLELTLPSIEALRERAEEACAAVAKLATTGGHIEYRRSHAGRRFPMWRPLLHAPKPRRNLPKRGAERQFIINLQLTWLESTEVLPSKAVNRDRPSSFAKMAAECFRLVGAADADVFGLINDVNRRRRELERLAIKTRTG